MDETTNQKLMAYVDGELDATGMRDVEQILEMDPNARRVVALYQETALWLRAAHAESGVENSAVAPAAAPQAAPPPRARHVPPPPPMPGRRPLHRREALAAASLVVAACAAAATWRLWPDPLDEIVDDIAEYHAVFSRETRHLVEVPAQERDHIVAWLGARLDHPVRIPDLTSEDLSFAGARLLVIGGRPAAQLMYTRPDGLPIAVCVAFAEGADRERREWKRRGLRLIAWQRNGYATIVVGEMPSAALDSVANKVARQIPA